jgi:hypothetical protein
VAPAYLSTDVPPAPEWAMLAARISLTAHSLMSQPWMSAALRLAGVPGQEP